MSTTEGQPAIGTPEFHRTRPPSVYTAGPLEFRRMHVWTDHQGIVQGNIALGAVEITFHDPAQVRDLIGRLAALAGEMDAEITRQQPELTRDAAGEVWPSDDRPGKPADPGWRDEATGLISGPLPEPSPLVCELCGATSAEGVLLMTVDDWPRCHNHERCAERVAARDAETAKVTP